MAAMEALRLDPDLGEAHTSLAAMLWLTYLHIDPGMDALRSNPRFQNLLRRVGLPFRG
jgi:hypothetical protein